MLQQLGRAIIVCIVDFGMVFLVMAGLQGVLWIMRRTLHRFESLPQKGALSQPAGEPHVAPVSSLHPATEPSHIAALTAAVQAFVAQPVGAFRIDYIEPLGERPTVAGAGQIAAITAAVQAFTGLAVSQFRIDSIQPLDAATFSLPPVIPAIAPVKPAALAVPQHRAVRAATDAWKLAGRLELMGMND